MAPITVINTYRSCVKNKRPWKNINRILSVVQDKETTKPVTAFDALYMKNIERQKLIKKKVKKHLTTQVEDRKRIIFEREESCLDSTFDRILAGPDFQKCYPKQDKSREFDSNCSSSLSSYFDTVALKDDTLDKTPEVLKRKYKSPKCYFTGTKQRKSCIQLKRHIKKRKNAKKAERSCLTSTPKGDKENQIDSVLSPILQNKTYKMENWSKVDKENSFVYFSMTRNSSENNMKDFSLISFKPDICKKSTETNSVRTYSTRKSSVNKVNERNCKDIECLVDNEKLYDVIHSFENLSTGESDVLRADDSCIEIMSGEHRQSNSISDEFVRFTNSDVNNELLTNNQTSIESEIGENILHELPKSVEESLILFRSWDSTDGSEGKHLQSLNEDLEQVENSNGDISSDIFSQHEDFLRNSDIKSKVSQGKSSDDDVPLIYLRNNCSELKKETAHKENSGKHLQSLNEDLEQVENSNGDISSDIFSQHEDFLRNSDIKSQVSERKSSDDDVPLIYLRNNCSELKKETAHKENSGSCSGRHSEDKLNVQNRKSSRRLSCRRFSHQVVSEQEDTESYITSPSFRDVYRVSRKKTSVAESIHEENEEMSITETEYELEQSNLISDEVDEFCVSFTARDAVLQRCCQCDPISFSEAFTSSYWETCRKIGEGVYGEVFMSEGEDGSVLKIIPIEGEQLVNGEPQKTFGEILSEIVITLELSNLSYSMENRTQSFAEMKRCLCVQGKYPKELMKLWNYYNDEKGSENDSPAMFTEDQLYIILEMANGGRDLEAYVFVSAEQSLSVLVQTAYALAVAEQALEFEHRDLHWGNVLISHTTEKEIVFRLCGKEHVVPTRGVQVAIIDFTLSRMSYDGCCIYNDLSRDPELFTAEGDYQFEVYRLMQKHTMNIWDKFVPYTNTLWLHYLTDKMCTMVHYQKKNTKSHKQAIELLKDLQTVLLNYNSASDFVLQNKINVI